jgi:Rrf2 family protein
MANTRFSVAVHILALLAIEGQETPLTSEYLANSAGTNPVVIRRMVSLLRKADLVTVQTGCNGGARLCLSPEQITLLDVYTAVGEIEPFSLGPRKPDAECITGRNLQPVLSGVLKQAEQAMALFLQGITIAQIVGEIQRREIQKPLELPI